jgi:O-antigen ligase
VTQQWWAVFPRYIADPELGTHFGRARGPTLMAASMGVYLTICGLALWYRCGNASRPLRLGLFTLLPLFCVAIFFTYTRSAWLGAAAAMLVVMSLELPTKWRRFAFGAVAAAGLLFVGAKWDSILSFKRDVHNTASDTRHSVEQRSSFTYVSWQMFKDHPVFGCGFGRFYDKKLPYLSDRRQQMEIDSLRSLQHHNTLLSVLVETGIVGVALFVVLIASLAQSAWNVVRAAGAPAWVRRFGVVMLATVATYLASAVFHDLSLSPTEHWILFSLAGITSGLQVLFVSPKTIVTGASAVGTMEHWNTGVLEC